MKRTLTMILALLLALAMLAGCGAAAPAGEGNDVPTPVPDAAAEEPAVEKEEAASAAEPVPAEPVTVRIGGLKGPTSIGLVKLLDDAKNGLTANAYEFTMAAAADELTPKLLKGELDVLAVPANLASILYNRSEGAVIEGKNSITLKVIKQAPDFAILKPGCFIWQFIF